ncbi:histidine triad (HIT) protein [Denitrovibrio acetiphilus DSM 12809]|uniref:Histidine triad (HIT) protein n=1 Tax=Denitrovibrio acetiphilus (strain DSM 12809 / NBRC 114555 / N2460) TaxID=522772 RepID=D4H6A6_DENA2|nr:HIT domain-containing protein [Denitrovibrio acetiphilus]ADD69580.1 histidine triad (HIT) protein [Denitrovibrio acetiphilus DSM 12809]
MEDSGVKRLWAPWRMSYISGIGKSDECVFCHNPAQDPSKDKENLILYRGRHNFIIMNLYPYNNGHLMVVPYKHTGDLCDLNDDEMLELMQLSQLTLRVFKKVFSPEGFNTGFNIGKAAGAGIRQHIHFHVLPRWTGDTNFMPVLGETRVISEHIFDTYDTLKEAFDLEAGK